MTDTPRIMVFDRLDQYLCDLDPDALRSAPYVTEVNGEHSLTLVTTQVLHKTDRILFRDGTGTWLEYVVLGINEEHVPNEYYCVWSLQYDLTATFVNGPYDCGIVPGHASIPQLPRTALECALSGTARWTIGTITVTTMAAASFYRRSGWEAIKTVLEKWGGELRAAITVDGGGVVSRQVDLLAHVGNQVATRRFEYGIDLKDIHRITPDEVWPCRIVPLGKAQETENGGYTRRPDISSVNNGVMWLQDDSVVEQVRILNPNGEYEYPITIVYNDTYEDPADLKAWGLAHIQEYTRPRVSYEASVVQFARAGLDAQGVGEGDNVVAVDRDFDPDGLRIDARVMRIAGDLTDDSQTELTIGNMGASFAADLGSIEHQMSQIGEVLERSQQYQATADYMANLIARLNAKANALGGYTYITEGDGIHTYDQPVSDPLVGDEADMVTEIRGGNIRIADSHDDNGDWEYRTLIESGHIAAELVTFVRAIGGYIGSPNRDTYIDIDGDTAHLGGRTVIGDRTAQALNESIDVLSNETASLSTRMADSIGALHSDLMAEINEARKSATDYINYSNGEITIGVTGTAIKNVIGAVRQSYRTDAGDVAWFGLNDDGVWEMFIETANVRNMMTFGKFAWIKRSNEHMSLKWIGE